MQNKNYTNHGNFSEFISPHLKKIIARAESAHDPAAEALLKQFTASEKENTILPCELADPLGAKRYQVTPRLIHQYKNRVLLLTTGICFSNCRFCFRRCSPSKQSGPITEKELNEVCRYLSHHPEVQEILFSGGDCLTLSDSLLEHLIVRVKKVHRVSIEKQMKQNSEKGYSCGQKNAGTICFDDLLIRICTRAPVFAPERFTPELISLLKKYKPVWVIPHINHPAELLYSPETISVFSDLLNSGIPVQSQTVLLRGINDSVETLSSLFHDLTVLGVKPGYLFQGDLVPGTSHFRVPLQEGLKLYEKLRIELSGLSTPVYAVDLPGGGGKVNLLQAAPDLLSTKVKKLSTVYRFTDRNGEKWKYPF